MFATQISRECIRIGDFKDDSKLNQIFIDSLESYMSSRDPINDLLYLKLNKTIVDLKSYIQSEDKEKFSNFAKFRNLQKLIKLTQLEFQKFQNKFPQESVNADKKTDKFNEVVARKLDDKASKLTL